MDGRRPLRGFALGEQGRADPELTVCQRGDQQLRRLRPGIAGAIQIEQAVGFAAGDRRQALAQLRVAQRPVPYGVVIGEKARRLVLGVADQQGNIV